MRPGWCGQSPWGCPARCTVVGRARMPLATGYSMPGGKLTSVQVPRSKPVSCLSGSQMRGPGHGLPVRGQTICLHHQGVISDYLEACTEAVFGWHLARGHSSFAAGLSVPEGILWNRGWPACSTPDRRPCLGSGALTILAPAALARSCMPKHTHPAQGCVGKLSAAPGKCLRKDCNCQWPGWV